MYIYFSLIGNKIFSLLQLMPGEDKMNDLQSPNRILSAIEARWGVKSM